MEYTAIESDKQYYAYCNMLEILLKSGADDEPTNSKVDLLTRLIQQWDEKHHTFANISPINLLHALMSEHHLTPKLMADMLKVQEDWFTEVLYSKQKLSQEHVQILTKHFKISESALEGILNII